MLRGVPDQLRIGTNAPNERVPLARLDFQKNPIARAIRNKIKPAQTKANMGCQRISFFYKYTSPSVLNK